MVLIMNQVIFPPEYANQLAKKYIEWMKEHPPDKAVEKILFMGIKTNEEGNVSAMGVVEVAKGKVTESMQRGTQQDLFLAAGLPGVKYKLEILMNFTEGYKVLNMAPPPEI